MRSEPSGTSLAVRRRDDARSGRARGRAYITGVNAGD